MKLSRSRRAAAATVMVFTLAGCTPQAIASFLGIGGPDLPATEPFLIAPSPTEPPTTEPPTAEPPTTEPPTTEPPSAAPTALPALAEPTVAEPAVAEPTIAEPAVAEPTIAEPAIAEPTVAEPAIADLYADVLSDDQLATLRACESHDNYEAVSASGKFRGAYQFSQSSWNGVAERHFPWLIDTDPAAAEPAWQDAAARALWSESGPRPWPTCGKRV